MTREEQLACLEDRPCSVCKFHTDRCNRWTCVFEDEPEEQEPCEDCISRADAIANIRILYPDMPVVDIMGARHKWSEKYQQYRDCEKILADLPSVQPKPKTGHWILQPSNKEQGERDFIWWKCSECGQVIYSETEQDRREYHAYCGRCGAKMLPTAVLQYGDQDTLMSAT